MNLLFPLPVYTFFKIAFKNGGLSVKKLKNTLPWLIKTILFEPLRWIELARYNKKVRQHTITKDPVFILGFYRSGTSFMHQFLTQDDRLGYPTNFQMVLPEIMLSCEKVLSPFLDFICRVFNIQDHVHRMRLSFTYPGEDDAAMTTALNPRGAQWGFFFPKMMMAQFHKYVLFENIPVSEIEAWKADYIFLLKKFSLANQGKQLVLKSPPNTARVKHLLSLFPKAKFILMHRNPYEVYASNQRYWKVTNRIYAVAKTNSVDNNEIILQSYALTTQRYLLEKHLIPDGQLIEMPYDDLMCNPIENMRKIYETLQLDDFDYIESKMKSYVDSQKSYVQLKHELPVAEKDVVSQRFEPFIRYWNYPLL